MIKVLYNETTKTATMIDGENQVELTKTSIDPKTKKVKYALPENSSNRKWLDRDTLIAKGEMTLEYKESRVLGQSTNPRKSLMNYLSDEDKSILEAIMNRAKEAKEADKKKPMTELEKAQRQLEKWTKRLEELQKVGK